MENMVKQRSETNQVRKNVCEIFPIYLSSISFFKKYYDFPETATESISSYTKQENGKTVPMWNKEQVDEIVAAQVSLFIQKNIGLNILKAT